MELGSVLDTARLYVKAGLSVIPVRADGSKAPAFGGWREYTDRLPTEEELIGWFADAGFGLGIPPGPASGHLAVIDFECRDGESAFHEWRATLPQELVAALMKCPIVKTPSGGVHVWVRLPSSAPGGILARYASKRTKIEVRGKGHQVLAPGCPVSCHATGKPYEWVNPIPNEWNAVEWSVWNSWLALAIERNEYSVPDVRVQAVPDRGPPTDEQPGTDFNRRATWEDTGLLEHGWRWERQAGPDRGTMTRPDKSNGVSATVGMVTSTKNGWPLFYCFSTSVPEFQSETPYTKFGVYTILNHGGDHTAAARELAYRGFGQAAAQVNVPTPLVAGSNGEPSPGQSEGKAPAPDRFFLWMSELRHREPNEKWVWNGYLSRGGVTLLSAMYKSGKTTLLSHLIRAFDGRTEEFCGQAIMPGRVLYITEEDQETWAERRDALRIGDHVGMVNRPWIGRPSMAQWVEFIGKCAKSVQEFRFDVVIMDTISKLWPVREENDANQVEDALMPLWQLTNAGAALLLVHHTRKSDGKEFTASRGSGGLPAFMETIIELRRFTETRKDTRRLLTAGGRYPETPDRYVIDLTPTGYIGLGDPDDVPEHSGEAPRDWAEQLDDIMPSHPPGLTIDQLEEALKSIGTGCRRQELLEVLNRRHAGGEYLRSGLGVKGKPFSYHKVPFDSGDTVPTPETHGEPNSGTESEGE